MPPSRRHHPPSGTQVNISEKELRARLDAEADRQVGCYRWVAAILTVIVVAGILVATWWFQLDLDWVALILTLGGIALGAVVWALLDRPASLEELNQQLLDWERRRWYEKHKLTLEQPDTKVEPPPVVRPVIAPPVEPAAPTPGASQREVELDYLNQRLEAWKRFIKPEEYTPLAGTGERRRRDGGAEIPQRFTFMRGIQELQRAARETLLAREREPLEFADVLEAIEQEKVRQVALLGDPGAGKTTTMRKIEYDHLTRALDDPEAPIPLFIPLEDWTHADQPLLAFMADHLGALGPYLDRLLAGKRAVLLLDALNQVPAAQRQTKGLLVKNLFADNPDLIALVSCRQADYQALDLDFDQIVIAPLDPGRILDFACRQLGSKEGERFFWQLAGGEKVRDVWHAWQRAGATFDLFWSAQEIPDEFQFRIPYTQHVIWHEHVRKPGSLIELASNPYMLVMLIAVYPEGGTLPANRGQLFDMFVNHLLVHEKIAMRDEVTREVTLSPEAEALLDALKRLSYKMQVNRTPAGDGADAVTVLPVEEVAPGILDEAQLHLARGAMILSGHDSIRFTHQLLQEYFVATYMREKIGWLWPEEEGRLATLLRAARRALRLPDGQLRADAIWPPARWWERTGWEEATVLLAGLYSDDCTPVLDWVAEAQPEVAAECVARSGAAIAEREATLERLRALWLPRLTDLRSEPDPRARAAVGRAVGLIDLDSRTGVGVRADGLPDIAWCEVPGGPCKIGGDGEAFRPLTAQEPDLPTFYISKYPVTHRQF
jgi:hypothetical protein